MFTIVIIKIELGRREDGGQGEFLKQTHAYETIFFTSGLLNYLLRGIFSFDAKLKTVRSSTILSTLFISYIYWIYYSDSYFMCS